MNWLGIQGHGVKVIWGHIWKTCGHDIFLVSWWIFIKLDITHHGLLAHGRRQSEQHFVSNARAQVLGVSSFSSYHSLCLRPTKVVAGGIMFSGHPSVRLWHSLCAWYLKRDWMYLHQTWHGYSLWRVDELIRYSRIWGQRSRSYGIIYKNLVWAISHEGFDGSSPNLT